MFLSSFAPLWDPEINFFTDPDFDGFRRTLDGVMKELQGKGIGVNRKQVEPILPEEEQMWKTGVLVVHTPQSLLDTMVYICRLYFALRSGREHRNLQLRQLRAAGGTPWGCAIHRIH